MYTHHIHRDICIYACISCMIYCIITIRKACRYFDVVYMSISHSSVIRLRLLVSFNRVLQSCSCGCGLYSV